MITLFWKMCSSCASVKVLSRSSFFELFSLLWIALTIFQIFELFFITFDSMVAFCRTLAAYSESANLSGYWTWNWAKSRDRLIKPNHLPGHPFIHPPTHPDNKGFRAFENDRCTLVFLKPHIHSLLIWKMERPSSGPQRACVRTSVHGEMIFCAERNHELLRLLLLKFWNWIFDWWSNIRQTSNLCTLHNSQGSHKFLVSNGVIKRFSFFYNIHAMHDILEWECSSIGEY